MITGEERNRFEEHNREAIAEHTKRRTALRAQYGEPEQFRDRALALRVTGLRDQVHPDDTMAYLYPSRECADAFGQSNAENNGVPTLALAEHEGRWLGILDIRLKGGLVTPPSVADDAGEEWRSAVRQHRSKDPRAGRAG